MKASGGRVTRTSGQLAWLRQPRSNIQNPELGCLALPPPPQQRGSGRLARLFAPPFRRRWLGDDNRRLAAQPFFSASCCWT